MKIALIGGLAALLAAGGAAAADREFKDECDGTGSFPAGRRGAWPNHFVDGGKKCDERKSEDCATNENGNCYGGDSGADGVDVIDLDGDGDLDIVTGWEESASLQVYFNPLFDGTDVSPYAVPPIAAGFPGRKGLQQWVTVDIRGGKSVSGIEDAIFADLTGDGVIDSVIASTEGGKRDMQIHALVHPDPSLGLPPDPFDKDHWKGREFDVSGGKFYLQSAYGDIDRRNCRDIVVGAKIGQDGAQTIDGGIWWFQCPAGWSPGDSLDPWTRRKLSDGHWVMNVVLDDIDGDQHLDVLFSDRKTITWLENPCTATAGQICSQEEITGEWTAHVIDAGKDAIAAWLADEGIDRGEDPASIPGEVFRDFDYFDLDGDQQKDIVANVNYDQSRGVVAIWYDRADNWKRYEIVVEGGLPYSKADGSEVSKGVSGGDMDLDGQLDLVISARGGERREDGNYVQGTGVSMFWLSHKGLGMNGSPRYSGAWSEYDIAPSYEIIKYDNVIIADLDRDCDLDVLSAEENATSGSQGLGVVWYENEMGGPPDARCRDRVHRITSGSSCSINYTASDIDNGSSSTDGTAPDLSISPSGPFGLGATDVTLTASRLCELKGGIDQGQYNTSDECNATVTVIDEVDPTLTCPASRSVQCDAVGGADVTFGAPSGFSDNCLETEDLGCSAESGDFFDLGTSTVTCRVADGSGNVGRCDFDVFVYDNVKPTVQAPAAVTGVECASPQGTMVELGTATASDTCDGEPAISNDAPALFPRGTRTVKWTATDASDNTSDPATQSVTVVDTTAPTIGVAADILGVECTSPNGTFVNLVAPAAGDTCSGVIVTHSPQGLFDLGPTTVTWTARDAVGLTASSTHQVSVRDTVAPTISTVPVERECTSPNGTPVALAATVSDACDASPSSSNDAPALFPLDTTTVSWDAEDASGNPAVPAMQDVTIVDTTAPSLTPPGDVVVECSGHDGTPALLGTPMVSDACSVAPTATVDDPGPYPLGTTTVLWTAEDAQGLSSDATQRVTVNDTTAPTIDCPADMTLEPVMPAGVEVQFAASATDVCDPAPAVTCSPGPGGPFAIGSLNPITCTAIDRSAVSASCEFVIEVLSLEAVVDTLGDRVDALRSGGVLNGGQAGAIGRELDAILASLADENTPAACGQLQGLASHLDDWVEEGVLSPEDAADLHVSIANIQGALGC